MKLSQFNKAAKRYSAGAALPLNEAQENLATFFGYPNYHAAQKALKDDAAAALVPPSPEGPAFWCDLSPQQFRMLCLALVKTDVLPSNGYIPGAEAVINGGLDYLSLNKSITLMEFINTLSLDSFCSIIESLIDADSSFDFNNSPAHIKSIGNYLFIGDIGRRWILPAEDRIGSAASPKLKKRREGGDYPHEGSFYYIVSKIVQPLSLIEQRGGAAKVKINNGSAFGLSPGLSIKELLDFVASERRVLTASEGLAILDATNVARVFG